MHLPNLPTVFIKDGVERKAYHTVEARELVADGWSEKGSSRKTVKTVPQAEEKKEDVAEKEEVKVRSSYNPKRSFNKKEGEE
jgi:hypothetical protein